MRGVVRGVTRGATVVAALFILVGPAAWADDPPAPTDPPQARLQPPVGITTQARLQPPVGSPAAPAGVTPQARLQPPVGGSAERDRGFVELMMSWLRSRISPPIG